MIGGLVGPGQVLVVGVQPMRNKGESDAVFESLEPLPEGPSGLHLRYAAIRPGENSCGGVGALAGWPPHGCKRHLYPLGGFHYRPGGSAQILVGASAPEAGTWVIPAFRLRYHVGDTKYATTYSQGMKVRVKKGYDALARIRK